MVIRRVMGAEMETRTPGFLSEPWGPGSHSDGRADSKGLMPSELGGSQWHFFQHLTKRIFTWELIYHLKPDSQAWSKKAKSDWESPYQPWKGRELQQQGTTSEGEGTASHPAPDTLTCWCSVTLLGLLPWAWKERMKLWLLGPLSVSVTIDYNDDFCMFCFSILVWLFFLFFSLIHRKTVSLSLFF